MDAIDKRRMGWILFWVLLVLFTATSILTIAALFFDLGNLEEKYKTPLVAAFVLEVGAAIIALFYSVFGLRMAKASKGMLPPANVKENVTVVEDSPLGVQVDLSKPVALDKDRPFAALSKAVPPYIASAEFLNRFSPSHVIFSANVEFGELSPNAVVTLLPNPLPQFGISLAEYMKNAAELLQSTGIVKGSREVRAGFDVGLQWYEMVLPFPSKDDKDRVLSLQVFQKFVVVGDRLVTLNVTYPTEPEDPEHIRLLQQLLADFGVARA